MNTENNKKDFGQLPAHQQIAAFELNSTMESVIETLTEREQLIIKLRYFDRLTRKVISEITAVSIERVRQIEFKAIRKLQYPTRMKKLEEFIN